MCKGRSCKGCLTWDKCEQYIEENEILNKEQKYLKLLKNVYTAYLRFDKEINAEINNTQKINIAYTWLDSNMSQIFDEIGEEFKK